MSGNNVVLGVSHMSGNNVVLGVSHMSGNNVLLGVIICQYKSGLETHFFNRNNDIMRIIYVYYSEKNIIFCGWLLGC